MIMAVVLGYLTARFVIGPILGYNADESPITAGNEKTEKNISKSGINHLFIKIKNKALEYEKK